jgi:hypothetical protein
MGRGRVSENQISTETDHHILRIISKNNRTTAAQVTAELSMHLEDPVSTKTVRRELHKSNIHDRATIAKPLITGSNAQMSERWCHDHKACTADNWKRMRNMVRWVILHAVTYIRKSLRLENTQRSLKSGMPASNSETHGRFCDVWAGISWYSILLALLLPFMAELLQMNTWTGWLIRCIPWSRRYFRTAMQFFKKTMLQFTQLGELRWFEEHEGELQHLPWPAQSPYLNIIETIW